MTSLFISIASVRETVGMSAAEDKKKIYLERVAACLYFTDWTKSALQAHTRTINQIYLKPLVEHCTKNKVNERSRSKRDEIESLTKGPQTEAKNLHASMMERLKETATRMTAWNADNMKPRNQEQMVSLAEMAAMHRLTIMVQMSGRLLDVIDRSASWIHKNISLLRKHPKTDFLSHVMTMFECTCSIAEIFKLAAVQRSECKSVYKKYMTGTDYKQRESDEFVIKEVKHYIPQLEAKLNNYRTCIYLIGSSLITIIQTLLRSIKQEQIDMRVREINEVLDRLPPMYLRVEDLELSATTLELLKDPPPNKRAYPLAPKDDSNINSIRSGKSFKCGRKTLSNRSVRSGKDESHATRQKYKNPIDKSNKSTQNSRSVSEKISTRANTPKASKSERTSVASNPTPASKTKSAREVKKK